MKPETRVAASRGNDLSLKMGDKGVIVEVDKGLELGQEQVRHELVSCSPKFYQQCFTLSGSGLDFAVSLEL